MDKFEYFFSGISNIHFEELVLNTGISYEDIYYMKKDQLISFTKIRKSTAEHIISKKASWDLEKEFESFLESGVNVISRGNSMYPDRLRFIEDAPDYLFYYGELPDDGIPSVAVIGSRQCSEYGRYMAKILGEGLAEAGIQVISGMAVGIDGISQMSAINKGGKTFGILGSGVDICYPRANRPLYDRLKLEGGVISEYQNKTQAKSSNFPLRNRIISGFSDALVVVEAKQKSGTIITVDCALSQGKDIFAVPGRVTDALSVGCNGLIKQGACPIQSVEDILEVINSKKMPKTALNQEYKRALNKYQESIEKNKSKKINLEREEDMVYSCLDFDALTVEDIANTVKMDISKIVCVLIGLEMKGYIREVGGNSYVRCF